MGWYTGDFNYNGLYAKYEGDNGFFIFNSFK